MGLIKLIIPILFLLPHWVLAQSEGTEMSTRYENYYRSHPSVQPLIQLNQSVFVPADSLYFSIQLVDQNLKHIAQTMFVDVLITDQDQNPLRQEKLKLVNGIGASALALDILSYIGQCSIIIYDQDGFLEISEKTFHILNNRDIKRLANENNKYIDVSEDGVNINNPLPKDITLLLCHADGVHTSQTIVTSETLKLSIDKLPEGLITLYLLNDKNNIQYSTYIVKGEKYNLNIDQYQLRSKNKTSLIANIEKNTDTSINAIVSCAMYNSLYNQYYLNTDSAADNIIRLVPQEFIQPPSNWLDQKPPSLLIKKSKYIITGTAYDDQKKILPIGSKIYFISHNQLALGVARVEEDGKFALNIPRLIGKDQVFYIGKLLNGNRINNIQIDWDENTIPQLSKTELANHGSVESPYVEYKRKSGLINIAYRPSYSLASAKSYDWPSFDQKYFSPDNIYEFRNYQLFPTMEEMMVEVIKALSIIKKRNTQHIILNKLEESKLNKAPLLIIDGVPTLDPKTLLNLKPNQLEKVEVYSDRNNLKKLGALGQYGIIIAHSKREFVEQHKSKHDWITGALPSVPKYSCSTTEDAIPVFSSTVYWQAGIPVRDGQFTLENFQTSDDIGDHMMVIQGITDRGIPFWSYHPISVVLGLED